MADPRVYGGDRLDMPAETAPDDGAADEDHSRRRPRRWPWLLVTLAVAVGGFAIWSNATGGEEPPANSQVTATVEFAEVIVTDLVEVSEYDGTLGRLEDDPVVVHRTGIVTAVQAEGAFIEQGDPIVWIDNEPVVLLYGELPAWRQMARDVEGPDVGQLEIALATLGFDPDEDMTVDEEYTSVTRDIVELWQEEKGADVDGIVGFGEVVFLPGPVRVDSLQVGVGDQVGQSTPVFTTSSDEVEVKFNLPTTEEESVTVGSAVEVTLPNLETTTGTVAQIATVATNDGPGTQATFEVVVRLNDPGAAGTIDEAPVTVDVLTDRADGVMAVPIEALLALTEGGYAVEVGTATGTRLVAVEPGFYADGLIEVTGDLTSGDLVVVP